MKQCHGRPERLCRPHAADRETARGLLPQAGHAAWCAYDEGCNDQSATPRRVRLRVHLSNGTSPKTLTMPGRVMAMSQRTRPTSRTSSSIIVTTSAAPPTSPTPRPTSRNSMPISLTVNFLLMSIHQARICRISSMVRNLTKRRGYITTGRGI